MKTLKKIILCLLVLCLLPSLSAFAEGESSAERGLEKIRTARNWNAIVLPQEESWLEEWKTLYARKAWYAPSLFVETMPAMKSGVPPQGFLFEGMEVTVVAEENDMSCIVYRGENHKLYTGWMKSIRLLEEFPGEQYSIGTAREGDLRTVEDVENAWSDSWFPDTHQLYTVLAEPVSDCVGFTLEYQVIAEHTAHKELNWGPRTVWVSDGENWTALDAFPYPAGGAVRVQVWLPEPMELAAFATTADCENPTLFDYRQLAEDFLLAP